MHLGLFLLWPHSDQRRDPARDLPRLTLQIISVETAQPSRPRLEAADPPPRVRKKTPAAASERAHQTAPAPDRIAPATPADSTTQTAGAAASPDLNLDVEKISQRMQNDFTRQEKFSAQPPASPYLVLRKKIAESATTIREGMREEHRFQFDGRPVTKVITPYGTYCIRHRKPGELPELTPPPVAMTCGNL